MTTSADMAEAARLVAWGARPKDRPERHEDYARLVTRYLAEGEFAEACDSVAAGLGLNLVVDPAVGVVATAERDSPLRMPLSDFMRRTSAERRALVGLVILSVARVAYPRSGHLDDPHRVPIVSVAAVVDTLRRVAERAGADQDDPDAERPEDTEVWRAWTALRQARVGAERASASDQSGLVKKVYDFLESEGHLMRASDDDGGTWRARPRLRLAVTSMVEDSDLFSGVLSLAGEVAR